MNMKHIVFFAVFFLDEFDKIVAPVARKAKDVGLVIVLYHTFETAAGGEFGLGHFDKLFNLLFCLKVEAVDDGETLAALSRL